MNDGHLDSRFTCPTCRQPVRLGGSRGRPEWVHEDGSAPCTVDAPPTQHERNYPLPRPSGDDLRFNFGLIYDVGKVLEAHGYPPVTGHDHLELRQAVFRFLYER